MPDTFVEWLTLILIGLLFAKDYLLKPLFGKLGITVNGINGSDKYEGRIKVLENHAKVANEEMGLIKEHLGQIREDIGFIKGQLAK